MEPLALNLSTDAAVYVRDKLAKRGKGIGVRVSIKTTGCSGLAYALEFVDEQQHGDKVFESQGIKFYIDPKSLPYVKGASMDYIKEGVNEGLKFTNPNAKGQCGCGKSFTA